MSRARHREDRGDNERSMLVLKVAAIVVLSGIGIGFLLLAASNGGGSDDAAVTNPAVPTIPDSGGPASGSTSDTVPAPVPRPAQTIPEPAVGAQTTVIAPKPKPKPTASPTRPGRDIRTARVDRPCKPEGSFAVTKRFEPLVCRNGRWDLLI